MAAANFLLCAMVMTGTNGVALNATATIGTSDPSTIVLKAVAPAGFEVGATSYGRGDWPMTIFFSKAGGLPVIPWYSALNETAPFFTNATGSEHIQQQRRVVASAAAAQ